MVSLQLLLFSLVEVKIDMGIFSSALMSQPTGRAAMARRVLEDLGMFPEFFENRCGEMHFNTFLMQLQTLRQLATYDNTCIFIEDIEIIFLTFLVLLINFNLAY